MTVRGEGGNHAMKDGMQLVELIDEGCTNARALVRKYEQVIIERGREAVQQTRFAAMDWDKGMVKAEWQKNLRKQNERDSE